MKTPKLALIILAALALVAKLSAAEADPNKKATRTCVIDKAIYVVEYTYNPIYFSVPNTYPAGDPHYHAKIKVTKFDGDGFKPVGQPFFGEYIEKGCFEDVPEKLVAQALAQTPNPKQETRNEKSPGKLDEKLASPWDAGQWTVSPFGSYRAHELGRFNGKFGGGLALSYAPARNIAIEVETLAEEYRSSPVIDSLEEAGVNFKGYLPIGKSGLAPYGFIGYTRNLQMDENRMNAGAGIEVRGPIVYAFADGRWTHDFATIGHALFRVGLGAHF